MLALLKVVGTFVGALMAIWLFAIGLSFVLAVVTFLVMILLALSPFVAVYVVRDTYFKT